MRLFVLAGLAACGPKIEPLAPMRAALAAARTNPGEGAPHANLHLSEPAMQGLVDGFLSPDRPLIVPVMMGTFAGIAPTLEPLDLQLEHHDSCDCTVATVGVVGSLDVELSGLMGAQVLARGLGFSGRMSVGPQFSFLPFETADGESGVGLYVSAEQRAPWAVDLRLAEEKGFLTNDLVDDQLESRLLSQLATPVRLAKLPDSMPVRPARMELANAETPVVSVWLEAEPADAPAPMTVKEGWGLAMSESALGSLARAVLATQQQHPRWKIEPLAVGLDGDRFSAHIRVHKKARKVRYREYDVTGSFSHANGEFSIVPDTIIPLEKVGWKGSIAGGIIDGQVRRRVLELRQVFPDQFDTKDERFPTRWFIDDVVSSEGQIRVTGRVEPVDSATN